MATPYQRTRTSLTVDECIDELRTKKFKAII
jgi:hypothetical protein